MKKELKKRSTPSDGTLDTYLTRLHKDKIFKEVGKQIESVKYDLKIGLIDKSEFITELKKLKCNNRFIDSLIDSEVSKFSGIQPSSRPTRSFKSKSNISNK